MIRLAAISTALVSLFASQDLVFDHLIKELQSDDYEVQGRAAKDLEFMGADVVPRLQKLADSRDAGADLRDWCRKIVAKIEANAKRIRDLVERLASPEDPVKEKAERELRAMGRAAIPVLRAVRTSEDKNLRLRADKLLRELATPEELEAWDWEGKLEDGAVLDGFEYKFRFKQLTLERPISSAVSASLKWLAHHQNPDGSWGAESFQRQCAGDRCEGAGNPAFDEGVTALALLAFLSAGHSHLSKEEHHDPTTPGRTLKFGEAVKNGLKWLLARQAKDGRIGGPKEKYLYSHCIATLVLCEAYGMTGARFLQMPAQLAVDFIVASQTSDRGWGYTSQAPSRTTVTGWAIAALKSADLAKLNVPLRECHEKARKWLDEVTDPTFYYRAGYDGKNSGKVTVEGKNESFAHHETMTAEAVVCRILMSKDKRDPGLGGVAILVKDLPEWTPENIDFYYWHWTTLALYAYDGPNGPHWKKWWGPVQNAIVNNLKTLKDGCQNGSWPSANERWGFEGGRVYATALNCITLLTSARLPKTGK